MCVDSASGVRQHVACPRSNCTDSFPPAAPDRIQPVNVKSISGTPRQDKDRHPLVGVRRMRSSPERLDRRLHGTHRTNVESIGGVGWHRSQLLAPINPSTVCAIRVMDTHELVHPCFHFLHCSMGYIDVLARRNISSACIALFFVVVVVVELWALPQARIMGRESTFKSTLARQPIRIDGTLFDCAKMARAPVRVPLSSNVVSCVNHPSPTADAVATAREEAAHCGRKHCFTNWHFSICHPHRTPPSTHPPTHPTLEQRCTPSLS